MKDRAAATIQTGWIYVPHPAAEPGWYRVVRAEHSGGWSEFHCGRPATFVVGSRVELCWSPDRPVGN